MAEGNKGKLARIVVDAALAVVYVSVMATALVQEAPHEYLGIALFALVIAHVVLNHRWFVHLMRGRYNVVRALQLTAIVGLLACIVAQVASSLVLSKYAFGFLPAIPGASWARHVHMLCSYWGFLFAFAHAGLQFQGVLNRLRQGGSDNRSAVGTWVARALFAAVACYGVYSFVQLGLPAYLTGQVQFAFADFETPLALTFARYAAIAVLVAGVFHYVRKIIGRKPMAGDKPSRDTRGVSR